MKSLVTLLCGLQFVLLSGLTEVINFVNGQCEAPLSFSLQLLIKPEYYKLSNEDVSHWVQSRNFYKVFTSYPNVPNPEELFCKSELLSSVEVEDITSNDIQKALQRQSYDNAASSSAKTAFSAAIFSNFVSTYLNEAVLSGFGVILSVLFPGVNFASVLGTGGEGQNTLSDVMNQAEPITFQSLLAQGIIALGSSGIVDDHTLEAAQATSDALFASTSTSNENTVDGGLENKVVLAAAEINEIYNLMKNMQESNRNTLCVKVCRNPSLYDENTILYCECDKTFVFSSISRQNNQIIDVFQEEESYGDTEFSVLFKPRQKKPLTTETQPSLLFSSTDKRIDAGLTRGTQRRHLQANYELNYAKQEENDQKTKGLSSDHNAYDIKRLKEMLNLEDQNIIRQTSEDWEDDHTQTTTLYYTVEEGKTRELQERDGRNRDNDVTTASETFPVTALNETTSILPTQIPTTFPNTIRNGSTTDLPTQLPTRAPTRSPSQIPSPIKPPSSMKSYLYTIKISGTFGLHKASIDDITVNTDSMLQKLALQAQGIYDESDWLLVQEVYETSQ